MAEEYYFESVGRRKAATARVRLWPVSSAEESSVIINDRALDDYFPRGKDAYHLLEPLRVTEREGRFKVTVLVQGGGMSGQSGAVRLGIARALIKAEPELRLVLRRGGFLTRDNRVKERKKPGLKRARKAPQYTKR